MMNAEILKVKGKNNLTKTCGQVYLGQTVGQVARGNHRGHDTGHVDDVPLGLDERRHQQPGQVVHSADVHVEHAVEGFHRRQLDGGPSAHCRVVH